MATGDGRARTKLAVIGIDRAESSALSTNIGAVSAYRSKFEILLGARS